VKNVFLKVSDVFNYRMYQVNVKYLKGDICELLDNGCLSMINENEGTAMELWKVFDILMK
jgi:hypothetical protein